MLNKWTFVLSCFLISSILSAQIGTGLRGKVENSKGESLPGINIVFVGTGSGTATALNGAYEMKNLNSGEYLVRVSGIGFKTQERRIKLAAYEILELNFMLESEGFEVDEVLVQSRSRAEELRSRGYSVSVIESKRQKNLTADVNQVLKSIPGINIRESGGLGSGFNLSLNGLSGNQVRYFIDGMPMENFGSSLTLNNFPVNLIDKLEVYKGVVPVSLGSDALGGAVNIVTGYNQTSFLDAAYSYGSFNTHRVSVNGQYADQQKEYYLKGSYFYNHSDNNYTMRNVTVYDLELGNSLGEKDIERFHDDYTSSMFHAEAGLFNGKYADKLAFSVKASSSRKNYQHPDNNIKRVFGDFHTKSNAFLVTGVYRKQIGNWGIKAYGIAGKINESTIDTSSRKYNWSGEFVTRSADDPKGELFERRSLLELTDFIARSNTGIEYSFNPVSRINFSFTQNYIERSGKDKVNEFNRSFESSNYIHKNLLALAYTLASKPFALDITIFAKKYWYAGKIISKDYEDNDIITKPSISNNGYGAAVSYNLYKNINLKTSFEHAVRIPESYEILGDGIYVNPNPELQPEKSDNFNLGILARGRISQFLISGEVNCFLRASRDFIRFNPLGPFGEYENLNNVRSEGAEGSFDINYRDFISFNTNLTYQHITERTKYDEGLLNTNYKNRVPNIPYFFGNARVGVSPGSKSDRNKIHLYWSIHYVHEFNLTWENLGDAEYHYIIPEQLTHSLQFEYTMNDGMYNLSFTVLNLFDKSVYDNYNIQKPGRSLSAKVRYFIN